MVRAVALLRGVNLAGRNKLPMAELRELAADLDIDEVSTYLQSGNLLFSAPRSQLTAVAQQLEEAILDRYEHEIRVLTRTRDDLEQIAQRNPFLDDEDDHAKLAVAFLEEAPAKARVADLDPERSPGDRFEVQGRELYAHYPNGLGRSKLTLDYLERTLGVVGTVRNWNTVRKLLERLDA